MPFTTTNILSPNKEIYNYLDNVNYGMSKPQLNHLSNLIQGLNYHFSHAEGKSVWSHCVVASNFVARDTSIPIDYKPYYREEQCKSIGKKFKSKMQLAKELVGNFKKPFNCEKIYVLADSWYTNNTLINESLTKGYHLIGAVKSNRMIAPKGIKLQLSKFKEYINPNTLDVVTVKGQDCKVYSYEGSVAKIENATVLICYEVDGDSLKEPVYLISTDIELDAKTIIEYYLNRWSIETNYKYLKSNLGFDKYRVRSIISIERYFLIAFLAINFIEIFRVSEKSLMLQTIGEAIHY